jgi:hypothetical protein
MQRSIRKQAIELSLRDAKKIVWPRKRLVEAREWWE